MNTITSLLYPDEPAGRLELENKLRELPAMRAVIVWPGILAAITADILEFLRMPVGDFAVSAYQKYQRVADAKRETAESRGRQVVQLMDHQIDHKMEPKVEIEINGIQQTLFNLELKIELSVESVTAIVEAGRLIDLAPGAATGSVSLSAAGVPLAKAESRPVDLAVPDHAKVLIDLTAMGEPIVDRITVSGSAQGRPAATA
jgi:hypothetical protein